MTKKQFRTRLSLLLILALILLGIIGFAVGKYFRITSQNGTVTFTASLATDVILQEHMAVRQKDGSYALVTAEYANRILGDKYDGETFVKENTYYLLPGLDVDKDPHIIIRGKTGIPAYLYVEVVDNIGNDAVKWEIDGSVWLQVAESGNKKVYVYKDVLDGTNTPEEAINILNHKKIEVSQFLNTDNKELTGSQLVFYVILIEKVGDATAAQTYENLTS